MTTYGWGNNNFGCLGVGENGINSVVYPPLSTSIDFVEAVSTDGVCTLFRTWNGLIYWAGSNQFSVDPGVSSFAEFHTPQLHSFSFPNPILKISMGSSGSSYLALDNQFKLWAWGTQTFGQFGIGSTTTITIPQVINTEVYDFAGDNTIIVLKKTSSGLFIIQTAGHNNKGACGDGTTTDNHTWVTVTKPPVSSSNPIWVAAAENAGGQTCWVGMSGSTIWGVGSSAEGELGLGTPSTPDTSAHTSWVQVTFPNGSLIDEDTFIHSAFGAVFVDYSDNRTIEAIGYDANNQLGLVGATSPFTGTAGQVDLTNVPGNVFFNKKAKGYPYQTNNCWIGSDGKPYVTGPMANPAGPTFAGNLQASTGLTGMQWVSSGSNVSGGGSIWAGVEPSTGACATNSGSFSAAGSEDMFGGSSGVPWPVTTPILLVATVTVTVTTPSTFNEVVIQISDTVGATLGIRQYEFVAPGAAVEPHIISRVWQVILPIPARTLIPAGNPINKIAIGAQSFVGTVAWTASLFCPGFVPPVTLPNYVAMF